MIVGGCLCGKITYEISGEICDVSNCHCSMCRKLHGAVFGTYGTVSAEDFRWISGEELIATYTSSEKYDRKFCTNCGSSLLAVDRKKHNRFYLPLGTVDGDPKCRPEYHIFVGSKAPWFEITDDLPQHETWSSDNEN